MMKLVLDSNIIFSAIIKKSITRDIILRNIFTLFQKINITKRWL